ncbi:helix-turn-helix transcriptional regulator [Halorussus salinisoli]|uniref:helix-turn-helix transcriptional regulator n=1 Tax=Halorussus salinisoli TaxID=2558242 RepID=UPI0010C2385D|nr:helix-turn-helix domain-containing protein [Halorussus salinisoli]
MGSPLDDVRFLAASENRVRVLTYLHDTPADRQELHEKTGISRPTLSRILSGFHDRGWVIQSGSHCEITPLGDSFVTEFTALMTLAETIQKLRDVGQWLPFEEMDIGPRHFEDANIVTVTENDPAAPMRRAKELTRQADHISFITKIFEESIVEVLWERAVNGELTAEVVITEEVVEMIGGNPEMAKLLREAVETGQVTFFRSDEEITHIVALIDESRAGMLVQDDDGVLRAELDTDDEAFRSWVASTIETHQRDAELIPAEDFRV